MPYLDLHCPVHGYHHYHKIATYCDNIAHCHHSWAISSNKKRCNMKLIPVRPSSCPIPILVYLFTEGKNAAATSESWPQHIHRPTWIHRSNQFRITYCTVVSHAHACMVSYTLCPWGQARAACRPTDQSTSPGDPVRKTFQLTQHGAVFPTQRMPSCKGSPAKSPPPGRLIKLWQIVGDFEGCQAGLHWSNHLLTNSIRHWRRPQEGEQKNPPTPWSYGNNALTKTWKELLNCCIRDRDWITIEWGNYLRPQRRQGNNTDIITKRNLACLHTVRCRPSCWRGSAEWLALILTNRTD